VLVDTELRALGADDLPLVHSLLADACAYDAAADVAEEKLFGPAPASAIAAPDSAVDPSASADEKPDAIGAFLRGPTASSSQRLIGAVVTSQRWIRLIAVHPDKRGRGVGSALLAAAESRVAARGSPLVRTLDQPGNYLAPGIDERNVDTVTWFERRSYRRVRENSNLLLPVRENPKVTPARAQEMARRAADAGYEVRRARRAERAALSPQIALGFSRAWAFEVDRALDQDPPAVHVAMTRTGELAGFAAHDGNNSGLGWFGPAGTFEQHRQHGLGEALLLACLVDVAEAGFDVCTIAWIGPRAFYERAAGPARERRFIVLAKDLAQAAAA
jgi:GNAT superfamily N-acetyltransferase